MGADITWAKGNKTFYFRDSYNDTNLAWIAGLSYWIDLSYPVVDDLVILEEQKDIFRVMARLSDKEICDYAMTKFKKEGKKVIDQMVACIKQKRDSIRKNMKLIEEATTVCWSV